jgi:two-component system sensor histidine kinase VicK
LEQVLQNLLQNAVKYSPDGGIVTVRIQQQGEQAWLAVSDQGIGIPQDSQGQLFQRFFRATNVSVQQIGGLGIGLYVAHEIVRRHGGTIDVQSREHEGATFTVRLPLAEDDRVTG